MASFIPNHRKKKEGLARKKEKLRRLIKQGASREKLLQAAALVLEGRIQVLRAKQNQNPERTAAERAVFLEDQERIEQLRALDAKAVLSEFLR